MVIIALLTDLLLLLAAALALVTCRELVGEPITIREPFFVNLSLPTGNEADGLMTTICCCSRSFWSF